MEIIKALKDSGLNGLGGAGYPTWQKWQAVKDAESGKKFVICNISEGEPGVFKDEYILQHHLPELISGINLASETVGAKRSYIFINDKFIKYIPKIKKNISGKKIEIFIDTGRYLSGEETTLLQVMEGKLRQPRQKPPYPNEAGLYGYPTLINNAETLYRAYLVAENKFEAKRFFSLSGDFVGKKIIEVKVDSKISDIIPKNILNKVKFVRISGASGSFLPAEKFDQIITGTGAVEFFGRDKKIINGLIDSITFLKNESCGKCTPCREGTYRIAEKLNQSQEINSPWDKSEIVEVLQEIASAAKESSFCPLGKSIANPVFSAIENFKEELFEN